MKLIEVNERGKCMRQRIMLGAVFLFFGVGFLLHQMDVWNFPQILGDWWPVILIGIGLLIIDRTSWVLSVILIIIGVVFLLERAADVNLGVFIGPIILIFIGLVIIFARGNRTKQIHKEQDINSFSFFSGADMRSESKEFKGGSLSTVFGGAAIDLRDIELHEAGAVLELSAIFGGIELKLPENIRVEVNGTPILGGIENKLRPIDEEAVNGPILKINYFAMFGGIEIRN